MNLRYKLFAKKTKDSGLFKYLFISFLILPLLFIYFSYYFYTVQIESVKNEKIKELNTIAQTKNKQISDWRNERISDGKVIAKNNLLHDEITGFINNNKNAERRENISSWLSLLMKSYNYQAAFLLNENYEKILAVDNDDVDISSEKLGEHLTDILSNHNDTLPFLTDLYHIDGTNETSELDLFIPMKDDSSSKPFAYLILKINPAKNLYELIQNWPGQESSAENFIVRKEGDSVLYLSELKFRKNSAMKYKVPVNDKSRLVVIAVQGFEGIKESYDYKGTEVLGISKKIPGTSWYLISKIDSGEIYGELNQSLKYRILFAVLIIIVLSVIKYMLLRNQKLKYFKTELEKQLLNEHYSFITRNANDMILLLDKKGNMVEANKKCCDTLGYTRDEILKINVREIRSANERESLREVVRIIEEKGSIVVETEYVTKTGEILPVESNIHLTEINGVQYYQSIARDITERKRNLEELRESEEKFRAIAEHNDIYIMQFDKNFCYTYINPALQNHIYFKGKQIIGKTAGDVFGDLPVVDYWNKCFKEVFDSGGPVSGQFNIYDDYYKCLFSPIFSGNGDVVSINASAMDITDLKQAEQKILNLNRVYSLLSNVSQAIVRIDNKKELLDEICRIVVATGKISMAWIGFTADNNKLISYAIKRSSGPVNKFEIDLSDSVYMMSPPVSALREKKTVFYNDLLQAPFPANWIEKFKENGINSSCSIPLMKNGETLGMFELYSSSIGFFNEEEINLLNELAEDIVFAVETIEHKEKRLSMENELNQSEERFRLIAENSTDLIAIVNSSNKFTYLSPSFKKILGYDKDALIGKEPLSIIYPPDMLKLREEKVTAKFQIRVYNSGKNLVWMEGTSYVINTKGENFFVGIGRDITERKLSEKIISDSLKEKETLLKEIHHRVKNNLQIISSLLKLQSNFVHDKKDKSILIDSQNRIKTMALIHQSLYKSDSLSKIDFNEYLKNLTANLIQINREKAHSLKLHLDAENIFFNIETAIPCGLLINELFTNCVKHAFPNGESGYIKISMTEEEENNYTLTIKDNGIGLPAGFNIEEAPTMGAQLISTLIQQIDGNLNILNHDGSTFVIKFKGVKYKERMK
jgi:PAS domain S-box-containing protein